MLTTALLTGIIDHVVRGRHTSSGGLAQLGERLHGMQEVSGSIPLFSTKKALYFAGSTVLFFLLKPMGAALLRLQRFRPSYTPKKICCPGADRAKQSLGKLWGQHLSFMFMVRSGVGAEIFHPCVIPGGQQMVAVWLGVFGDQVAILVGQRLPEVQEGAAFF